MYKKIVNRLILRLNSRPFNTASLLAMAAAWLLFQLLPIPVFADDGGETHSNIIASVGIAIVAATVVGYVSNMLKQPLLLAYILAGVLIGPRIGFSLIKNIQDIETISHFGLILLLFLIGLEIDIKKLRAAGKSLLISGLLQFPITMLIGIGFFLLLGYTWRAGHYDLIYLAACCSLSSTAIVVKLLYSKFELDTLAGRITLGILVFQDIWAIVLLGIQPNLANPELLQILLSFGKGFLLVIFSMSVSKYILPRLFKAVSKVPELILISSLAWCFFICGLAGYFELSIEMGALIAGVAISTFPYNLDVIAKVTNIRDFFITLFFVTLGMQIPNPLENLPILFVAALCSLFLIVSRFLAIFPVLYVLKNGLRVSLLPSINLTQISEFSLVIGTLGLAAGHIVPETLSIIIFIFVITSISSTYMVKYNNQIQRKGTALLKRLGFKDIANLGEQAEEQATQDIVVLGFYRTASALLHEILNQEDGSGPSLKEKLVVVDFNPEVHQSLNSLGVKVIYADISHPDTLHHSGLHDAKVVISTIPDTVLVGTNNMKIIRHVKEISPHAKIIVTAESSDMALKMYKAGAHYVMVPQIISARHLVPIIRQVMEGRDDEYLKHVAHEMTQLKNRAEILR